MLQLLRSSPALSAWLILLLIGVVICGTIGFSMHRAGVSTRPILWFGGYFLLVGAPSIIGLLVVGVASGRAAAPTAAALKVLAAGADPAARLAAVRVLFGSDVQPELVTDARNLFGPAFASAEVAQMASFPTGETMVVASFRGYTEAEKAWVAYLNFTGFNQLKGKGDSQAGYVVTRPTGDRAYTLHMRDMVGAWVGPSDPAIRQRMARAGIRTPGRAPLAGEAIAPEVVASSSSTSTQARTAPGWWTSTPARAGLVVVGVGYLLFLVAYFFKGSSWAAEASAKPGVVALDASALSIRLDSINQAGVPFVVQPGTRANERFVTWRYADARWLDFAGAHKMSRVFRIRLTLDESARVVRATDFVGTLDASAGRGEANVAWTYASGIVLFQKEHQRVFGLQLDEQGRFKPNLSYAYTFDLQEMKSPLIEAVTSAGWNWRPVGWQGPAWLRWLTE